MKKSFLSAMFFLAACLLHPASSSAQSPVNVTATVTDPSGIPYANATVSILLLPVGGATVGGNQILTTNNGLLDSSGKLNVSMYKNSDISPGGSTWQFTICETPGIDPPLGAGGVCFTSAQTVSAAVDFSTQFTAASKALGIGPTAGRYCVLNDIYVVGSSCYPTILSAVTAAGATGSVQIPANYAGTDVIPVLNGVAIDDLRVTNGLNETRFWSVLAPSFPVTNFPGGNDLVLRTRGSADSYREHLVTRTTTATSLNVGANNNILVAAVTVGNLTRGNVQTGDTSLLGNPSILGLSVGRDTANAEVILAGSWSVVDATHLNITCAKSHASIVDIDLGASDLILSVGTLIVNSAVVKASQTSTYNPPLVIQDSTGITIGKWPTNRGDIWPHSAWQFSAPVTGGYSGGVDLYLRALTSAAKLQYWDFAGTEKLWDVSNDGIWLVNGNGSTRPNFQFNHDSASGNGVNTFWQYNGATVLLITANADTPRILGGGTSGGISFYGSNGSTGTSGLIRFRNNSTDETQKASLDTSNGNLVSVGSGLFGPVTVGALPAAAAGNKGQMITVSDSTAVTAEGQTCVGGSTNTALAFSNGTVWKCF